MERELITRSEFEASLAAKAPFSRSRFALMSPAAAQSRANATFADVWEAVGDLGVDLGAVTRARSFASELGVVFEFSARGGPFGQTPFALVFSRRARGVPESCRIYLSSALSARVSGRPGAYYPTDFKTALPDHMILFYSASRSGDPKKFTGIFETEPAPKFSLETGRVLTLDSDGARESVHELLAAKGVTRSIYHALYECAWATAVEVSSYREQTESPEIATPGLMVFGLSGTATAISSVDRRFHEMRMYGDVWRV